MPAYLSDALLTGSHIDQLLARLRQQLENIPEFGWAVSHSLVGPDFFLSIIAASNNTAENVELLQKYKAIRLLKFDLVSGHCTSVGGTAYLGYGDSMGGQMPKDLRRAMLWWIARLIDKGLDRGQNVPIDQWIRLLPIALQPTYDGHSCGMLAVNALAHHYIPHVDLVETTQTSLAIERISAFNDIC
ncbi:hypothetical protein BC835DRAFT_1423523 [Cytidiella melzeri]|nr:hypothetical protein BC835DRAFT_1423523 [Cytidiella melzeri]